MTKDTEVTNAAYTYTDTFRFSTKDVKKCEKDGTLYITARFSKKDLQRLSQYDTYDLVYEIPVDNFEK